jgi:hypothetical protein
MERFEHFLRWCIDHWKAWGIPTIVTSVVGAGTWLLARRKEWNETRRANAEKELDSKVFKALQNRDLWNSRRGMTGAGDPLVRSAELAQTLRLDCDTVNDSLERLEARGRVRNAGGTLDNSAPYWHILHR